MLACARVAGVMAAKRTSDLIPMCHPLNITKAKVDCEPVAACLTVYDMCKAVDRGMEITDVRLLKKDGGKTGLWER